MNNYNLLTTPWVPVLLPDGTVQKMTPAEVADSDALEVAHPRPDFRGLITEFLVCLFQTLATDEKRVGAKRTLSKAGYEALVPQFNLFGDGVRFMQSVEPMGKEPVPTASLPFEAPQESTRNGNRDLFVSRYDYQAICPHCAPALLMLNQAHARTGGTGYCVSVRGGSAMTVFLKGQTLRETIALNVLPASEFARSHAVPGAPEGVFPWETQAFFEKEGEAVPLENLGAHGVLWWTPVALRLTARENREGQACSLCGEVHEVLLGKDTWRAATGFKFPGGIYHPHTTFYSNNKNEVLPQLVPPNRAALKEWVSLNLGNADEVQALPALKYAGYSFNSKPRMWAFGPRCDKNTFDRWFEETLPILHREGLGEAVLRQHAQALLDETRKATSELSKQLAQPKNTSIQKFVQLKGATPECLTELELLARDQVAVALEQVSLEDGEMPKQALMDFQVAVWTKALQLFDKYVEFNLADAARLTTTLRKREALNKRLLSVRFPKEQKPKSGSRRSKAAVSA